MATGTSNPFNVGISNTPTFSMPSVQDERATYTLWGWTWNEATANPVYDSAARGPSNPNYIIANPDIHGDTECDDVWAYLQAYLRRTSGREGYRLRAKGWRDYYVNNFNPGAPEYNNDASFLYDHFYGWGLQQYATQFSDAAAGAKALTISTALHDWWAAGGRSQSGNWPVAGVFDIAHYGHRGPSRNLHTAVAIADATIASGTPDAKAIELRDRLIDLWLQSPDWDDVHGMYWVSQEQMVGYGLIPPLSYAAGDRAVSSFHIGQLAEAFFAAWLSPTVTAGRKTAIRSKIVAMANYMLHNGLDPTYRYCASELGIRGSGAPWWVYSLTAPVTFWDGVYTTSIVNLLVMGYKLTGDRNFLDATPGNNLYPAKYCFNRGTKSIYSFTDTTREAPDNVAGHFVDTQFDSSTEDVYLAHNKSELQYTYLIFENGGSPTVFP